MIQEQYRTFAAYLERGIEAIHKTGIRVVECRDRYVKLMLPLQGNVNHLGMMYAGSMSTLGEVTGGAISGVSFGVTEYFPIIKELKVRFIRPAMSDITLEASISEETIRECREKLAVKGKADFALELKLIDAQGEVVAQVNNLYQVRPIPEGLANPVVDFKG
jgi:acyl-coenzyme A thioesterase PaaI-like protein